MRIFKTRLFHRWAQSESIADSALQQAIDEIAAGLLDANLGGAVYKKRVAAHSRGKRGGVRTLIALRSGQTAFFIYGFSKNQRDNITGTELKALKTMAAELLNYSDKTLMNLLGKGSLIEVQTHE